jgi:hypothetical protein
VESYTLEKVGQEEVDLNQEVIQSWLQRLDGILNKYLNRLVL